MLQLQPSLPHFHECYATRLDSRKYDLCRAGKRTETGQLILGQGISGGEGRQHGKRCTRCALGYWDGCTAGAAARHFGVGDVRNHVDQADVKGRAGSHLDEEL